MVVQMPLHLPADTDLSSPQIKLIKDWNEGLVEKNAEIVGRYFHKDFHRVVHPRSLGQPNQSREEALKELPGIRT